MQPPATPATPVPCGNAAFAPDMNLAADQTTHILHDHDGESSAKLKAGMPMSTLCSCSFASLVYPATLQSQQSLRSCLPVLELPMHSRQRLVRVKLER